MTEPSDEAARRAERRRRIAMAWRLALASGGVDALRAARRVLAVARAAPTTVPPVAAIVVPGFRLRDGEVGRGYAERVHRAFALWSQNPRATLLLSGAAARGQLVSEAEAALCLLSDLGLPRDARVLLDRAACNTAENLLNARSVLGSRHATGVAIVSSRYHLARCGVLARRLGLGWSLCAAEPRWRWSAFDALALAREAGALLATVGRRGLDFDPQDLLR